MAILGNWVCISGVRRTTPGWIHDLSVKVDAHAGIDRVEFDVVANGTPWDTLVASRADFRTPNFGDSPSPLPGVASGMAPFLGWGVGLDLSAAPAGTLVVTATVFDTLGNSRVLADTMTVYNDTDGTDRRPRAVTVYADGTSGNDANNGTSWALAVKTLGRARALARSGGGDVSGARILCRGTFTDIGGGNFPQCSTSGAWWCDFVADAAGAYLNPPEAGSRALSSGVTGTSSSTVICRNRFVGFRFGSASLTSFTWGGIVWNWFDGCWMQGADWVSGRSSVLYADPARGVQGYFVGWDGSPAATPGVRFFTGCNIRGAVLGFEPSRLLYDSRVDDFTGISAKIGSASSPSVVGAFVMQGERYSPRVVHGFVRMDSDPVQGKGRPALTVTKPSGSTARITGPVGGYAFDIDADDLVGNTYWGLRFEGSGVGLDTGVGLLVTAVGNTGGAPWVEVTAPGASAGSISANTCSFYTARVGTGMNYWNIHPDGIQIERNLALGDAIFDCALVDAPDLQSYFTSGNDGDKVLIENIRDDGSGLNVMNMFGADFTDSILQRIVSAGQFQNSGGGSGWAGTIVRNCVFGSLGGDASTIPSRGGTVSYCHVISGSSWGSNGTTGSWFAGTPTVSPFSFEPSGTRLGTGSPAVEDPAEWAYSGTGSTRGVLRNVGELDWSIGAPGVTVEVDPGPGTSAYASARYDAQVDGEACYVWSHSRTTIIQTDVASPGNTIEACFAKFGADGPTTVSIGLISGTVTAVEVYPQGVVTATVSGGRAVLSAVPVGAQLRVEINGDRRNPMHVFSQALKPALPVSRTDWTSIAARNIASIVTSTNVVTMAAEHPWTAGQQVIMATSGTLPAVAGEPLTVHTPLYVLAPGPTTMQLARSPGGAAIDFTGTGTGTHTLKAASWSNASSALYFPAGVHVVGRIFGLGSGVTVYVDRGAIVIGGWSLIGTDNVRLTVPGVLGGMFATSEEVAAIGDFNERIRYSMFLGYDGVKFDFANDIELATVLGQPFFCSFLGLNTWTDVAILSPWYWELNGPDFAVRQFGVDHTASATRVFAWCGDDTFTIGESVSYCDLTIEQCFAVTMANSCYHLGYWSQPPTGFPTRIQNSHAMHLGIVDTNADGLFPVRGGNTIFKGWSDGFVGEENYGRFLVTIAELDVWGPIRSRVFHLGNRIYPFGIFDRARKGQIANWTISGLRVHQTPGQVSIIESLDASNTPHHIAITDSSIGGTPLTAGNWTTFVSMSPEAYQITVNGVRVDRIDTTGTATLQLGAAGTSGLVVGTSGGAAVSIGAAGASGLLIASSGQATVWVRAGGTSEIGAVVPETPAVPANVARGPGVAPGRRLRRTGWWTWLQPWG